MHTVPKLEVNPPNAWRIETPGSAGWAKSPRAGAAEKYFIVSCDAHMAMPPTLIRDRVDAQYRDRCPRMERDKDGVLWSIVEGVLPAKVFEAELEGEDQYRSKSGAMGSLADDSSHIDKRLADLDLDGVDAELIFPNGAALMAFWTSDPHFGQAQFRVYNDWAAEVTAAHRKRMNVAACIATGDVDSAVSEIQRVAKMGFRVLTLPVKPIFGPSTPGQLNYNSRIFDPMWAAIEEADLTITFHVATGIDPRTAQGPGGAIINYVAHAMSPIIEPVASLCASGVLDRFSKLRFATIEAGLGWVPWLLESMDQAYVKHHMWIRPKLKNGLPSEYFRAHGAAQFAEDHVGMELLEAHNLVDNVVWGNDYPHHEGTFPHSSAAIERQMAGVKEKTREKILGLNAARLFKFELP